MLPRLTDSRLASLGARAIHDAFVAYRERFVDITLRARGRFELRQWRAGSQDAAERLALYRLSIDRVVAEIGELLADRFEDRDVWASMKAVYSGLASGHEQWELAETFFNSVTRRVFATMGLDPRIEFADTDFAHPPIESSAPQTRRYAGRDLVSLIEAVLADYRFDLRYQDVQRDARLVAQRILQHLRDAGAPPVIDHADVLEPVFFRGKRAFVIGRLNTGLDRLPLILALRNMRDGIVVDAVLLEENDVSALFSFARAYFQVAARRPYDVVRFLRTLMPRKRVAEIYNSIGHPKHGKTELFRDLRGHLAVPGARFTHAPGVRGLVMIAFAMSSLDLVFKVIRDRFPPEKTTSRDEVMARYEMVFAHDRAGRLVEAQHFEHLALERSLFAPELIDELTGDAADCVLLRGDEVILDHVYVERRVRPLDLYLRQADPDLARAAIIDWGHAIKDLAKRDIFPGDILLKNFGVTRHGRVVFYDYDEITTLLECNFRKLPPSRSDEDEMAAEPWFAVGPNDIFPQELRTFVGLDAYALALLDEHHPELFDYRWWKSIQDRLRAGEVIRIPPYPASRRLRQLVYGSGLGAPRAPAAAP